MGQEEGSLLSSGDRIKETAVSFQIVSNSTFFCCRLEKGKTEQEDFHSKQSHISIQKCDSHPILLTSLAFGAPHVYGDTSLRRGRGAVSLSRNLSPHGNSFRPLSCNANMPPCEAWSTQGFDPFAGILVIPCGKCITFDVSEDILSLPNGLNIEGKLVFPDGHQVTIETPFIVVQGELEMTSTRATSAEEDIKIILTEQPGGVSFTPHQENSGVCGGVCSFGERPVAIAGGTLNIKGLPETCPSWVKLKNVVTGGPGTISNPPQYIPPSTGCANELIQSDFEGNTGISWPSGWYRNYGGTHSYETANAAVPGSTYAMFGGRTSTWNGPQTNLDVSCIVPDTTYFIYAKARLTKPGGLSNCHQYGTNCLKLISFMNDSDIGKKWRSRGGGAQHNDGEWFEFISTTIFTAKEADAATAIDRRLYWEGPEPGVEIALDDVRIFRQPESAFANAGSCSELISANGDVEDVSIHPFTYPARTYNGFLSVESEGDSNSGTLNHFYSLKNRQWDSSSPVYTLPTDCIEPLSIYSFSVDVRVHSDTKIKYRLQLTIEYDDGSGEYPWLGECQEQDNSDGWVTCKSSYQFKEFQKSVKEIRYYLVSFTSYANYLADTDFDNFSVTFEAAPTTSLILPDPNGGLESCWGPNSELLVTSNNLNFDDVHTPTIKSVSSNGDSTVTVELNDPMPMTSYEDAEGDFAVEVALLSRNIAFSSDSDVYSEGGHLIIMHTEESQQLDGVSFKKFGQQGTLGRYPVHFHMCGSAPGSEVSRNVVRQSNQRCYVLHGSHDITLDSNICYDNFGHGFLLEDHAERNNVFTNNLAAVTKKVITKIRPEETDDFPSSYWITNPENTFIGNVAAGSEHSGFWFEMSFSVRGPSAAMPMNSGYNPREQPLTMFQGNIAHSNDEHGIKTYPGAGYFPTGNAAVFKDCLSYRNSGNGVFIHNSGNIKIEGGLFADNRVQVDLDRSPTCIVDGASVVGYSDEFRYIKETTRTRGHCPSSWPIRGVELHTYWAGGSVYTGSSVVNTSFENFGDATECDDSVALLVDEENKGYFDVRTEVENLTFASTSTKTLSNCVADTQTARLDNFILHDKDGSIMGQSGFIVSDTHALTAFSNNCVSDTASCTAHCAGECYRTYALAVSTLEDPASVELEITDIHSNEIITIQSTYEIPLDSDGSVNVAEHTKTHRNNLFFAVLPSNGEYSARFTKNGYDHWPVFVRAEYDDPGSSCPEFTSFTLQEPADGESCNELIRNGDMEAGIDDWWATMGGLVSVDESASGQGLALTSEYRTASWMGPAQYLDSRCLPVGAQYSVSAKVKMVKASDHSIAVDCDRSADKCPKMIAKLESGAHQERDQVWKLIAHLPTAETWNANGWNVLTGTFTVDQAVADAGSVLMYFESQTVTDTLMVIDDVSITLDSWPAGVP